MAEQQREVRLYAKRDIMELGKFYTRHVDHMTSEGLHDKSSIAAELAYRDWYIAELEEALSKAALSHAEGEAPNVYWVLFDATADKKFIKKSLNDGSLAFFDTEQEAIRAKARHPGTDYMRVEYYKRPAPQVAVPEGYALVPVEQTEEMLDAWFTAPRGDSGSVQDFSTAYAALLAAAPTAPAGGPERDLLRRYRQAVEKTHRARRATPAAPSTDLNRALVEQERVEAEIDALLVDTGEEEWVGSKRRADLARQLREYSQRKETKPVIDPDGLRAAASALLEKLPTDEIGLAAFHAGDEVRALISALGTPAPDEREIAAKALDEMADTIAAMSDESDNSAASRALYRAAARCNARAGRLRAGKEGE